ncbi:hypothetical protein K438DRAFT_1925837 [Mycena galopus ATCC 62051]|nr:hypothetical protein K438DRAFT_1925837 [Mycena galopus ATCC 62051]
MANSESLHSCPKCSHVFSVFPWDQPFPPLTAVSQNILKTNDPPLESHIPVLREFVSEGRARVTALDAKIALLTFSLELLREEKHELDAKISMHEAAISLLRRMPTEIMTHIFTFTLPPHQLSASAPWTIGAVCARWRAIVVSQPCFWTHIRYETDHPGSCTDRLKFETQLRRSGQSLLNVEFTVNQRLQLSIDEACILQLISAHAGRWETVSLSGPDEIYSHLRIQEQLANLRKLTLEIVHEDDDTLLDIFHDAPQLQTVSFNRDTWEYPAAIVLPWSQLLRYGGNNTWDGHLHALSGASNLVDCSPEIQGTSSSTQILPTPVVLPRLRRLSLSDSQFLGCLETPALLELYSDRNALPMLSFLRQQTCKLQKLVLWESSEPFAPADLTRIVEAVPTITHLALLFSLPVEFSQALRSCLTMVPGLEHFSTFLDNHSDLEGVQDAVEEVQDYAMEAIESRWLGGRLKTAKLYGIDMDLSRIHNRLELLRNQGMECVALHGSRYAHLLNLDIPLELVISTMLP